MNSQSVLAGKKILIVDDELDILETVVDLLEDCQVDIAQTFEEAVQKMDRQHYDAAILDIMGVNGYNLLEIARKKNLTAMMLTAHALSPDSMVKSYLGGAVSYVPKEQMVSLPEILENIFNNLQKGRDFLWRHWLEKSEDFFNKTFGEDWREKCKIITKK